MPHVSKNQLTRDAKHDVDERVVLFLIDTKSGDRKRIFRELLTKTERMMLAKRLTLLFLISRNVPPYAMSRFLKMSSSTIFRFQEEVNQGKYTNTLEWLSPKSITKKFLDLLADIAAVPFEAKRKSLWQLLKESEEHHKK